MDLSLDNERRGSVS